MAKIPIQSKNPNIPGFLYLDTSDNKIHYRTDNIDKIIGETEQSNIVLNNYPLDLSILEYDKLELYQKRDKDILDTTGFGSLLHRTFYINDYIAISYYWDSSFEDGYFTKLIYNGSKYVYNSYINNSYYYTPILISNGDPYVIIGYGISTHHWPHTAKTYHILKNYQFPSFNPNLNSKAGINKYTGTGFVFDNTNKIMYYFGTPSLYGKIDMNSIPYPEDIDFIYKILCFKNKSYFVYKSTKKTTQNKDIIKLYYFTENINSINFIESYISPIHNFNSNNTFRCGGTYQNKIPIAIDHTSSDNHLNDIIYIDSLNLNNWIETNHLLFSDSNYTESYYKWKNTASQQSLLTSPSENAFFINQNINPKNPFIFNLTMFYPDLEAWIFNINNGSKGYSLKFTHDTYTGHLNIYNIIDNSYNKTLLSSITTPYDGGNIKIEGDFDSINITINNYSNKTYKINNINSSSLNFIEKCCEVGFIAPTSGSNIKTFEHFTLIN